MKNFIKIAIIALVEGISGWHFGVSVAVLWALFAAFILYEWDYRIIGVGALTCFAVCPFLLHFKQNAWAETIAIYAFFFLAMTIALQIIDYKRHPERYEEPTNANK